MYPSIDDDEDLLAALCFDQSNGAEDPYAYIQTDLSNFGSCDENLQQEQEQVCDIGAQFGPFSGNLSQFYNVREENNGGGVYSSSIGSAQLDLGTSYSRVSRQICSFRGGNEDSGTHVQQEHEQMCSQVVEINSSSSDGTVKQKQEHVEDECSRKRGRNGSCSKPGTKACRGKIRSEKLNDRFMDLSSVLEPGRTPKTDKSAIMDDAIRAVNQLRDEVHELKETNQKLLEEIKILKVEKTELREEKLALKEKTEQQLKAMAVPSPGFIPSHPAAFHPNKLTVYPSYGYYPNMQMWPYLHPMDLDTSHDHLKRPPAA